MAIKKIYYTWKDVKHMCGQIINQLYKDQWKPDYIVGITRGGNVPATILSNTTGIRCEALKVSLRDGESGKYGDSIEWMAEDALKGKKILIVDGRQTNSLSIKKIGIVKVFQIKGQLEVIIILTS